MTELPKSWSIVNVGSVSNAIQYGYTASATYEAVGPRMLRITDIQDGNVDWPNVPYCEIGKSELEKFAIKPGDIVFARTGGTVGKSFLIRHVPEPAVFASYLIRVSLNPAIDPRYVYWFFQSLAYWEQIGLKKGGLQGNVNATTLATVQFSLPPLPEQHRIVARIEELFSELDASVESLTKARALLGLYRQSLLKAAFQGKLTADWRAANPDKLAPAETLLSRIRKERETRYAKALEDWQTALSEWRNKGEKGRKPSRPSQLRDFRDDLDDIEIDLDLLPHGWAWSRLGYSSMGTEYGTSAKSAESGKVPVIRMGNLQQGRIDWNDLVFTSEEEEIEKYRLFSNDVLFNRTNSPELVGKTAIYRGERPAVFAGYLVRVNQITDILLPEYLCYFLNSHTARRHGDTVKTDGVNQSNINGNKLQEYPFPYCHIEEQRQVVLLLDEKLSAVDASETEITTALNRIAALRQSILKLAFSGRLVPQDANDEPASALLARLQTSPVTKRRSRA